MNSTQGRSTCLISHNAQLSEVDFLAQNIEYSLRTKEVRLHGVLSPYSKSYGKTILGLEKICRKLNEVYGIKSLIVDISVAGDSAVLKRVNTLNSERNEKGVYSTQDKILNYLLLTKSLEEGGSNLLEDLLFWKTIEEAKKSFDILFLLPSLKNPTLIEQLEVNAEVQWLFIDRKNSSKIYKNIKNQTHFQVPFMGLVTV